VTFYTFPFLSFFLSSPTPTKSSATAKKQGVRRGGQIAAGGNGFYGAAD